ncbi:hypothetical protein ABK040_014767 [Willaertia magna]
MTIIKRLRGFSDFLPNQFQTKAFQKIIKQGEEVANGYEYKFIQTPILEEKKLFERSLGNDTDVISKEMFTIYPKGGGEDTICLRPENTASIMRSIIEHSTTLPQKLFYYGPMFRFERPQKGRQRQFHQFGAEYIGTDSYQSDVEIIDFAYQFLNKILNNRKDLFHLEINSIGTLEERTIYQDELFKYILRNKELFERTNEEGKHLFSHETLTRIHKATTEGNARKVWRILDSKEDENLIKDLIENHQMPTLQNYQNENNRKRFELVLKGLESLNIPYTINSSLIRGLDYYTHTTFEFKNFSTLGSKSTVLAGGRYDDLSKQLNYVKAIPSIGWACGMERLMIILEDLSKEKPIVEEAFENKIFVACVREKEEEGKNETNEKINRYAMRLCQQLRLNGFIVGYYEKNILSKQLKRAQESKARLCCIIGEDEIQRNEIIVKDLSNGIQRPVNENNIVSFLKEQFQIIGTKQE